MPSVSAVTAPARVPNAPEDILSVHIRPAGENDWPFIEDSWRRSLTSSRFSRGGVDRPKPSRGWFSKITGRIAALRERGAAFLVACDPEDRSQILGWACFEKPVVHYVFVKEYFRENGVARSLLADFADQSVLLCSEWTVAMKPIAAKHGAQLRKVLPC